MDLVRRRLNHTARPFHSDTFSDSLLLRLSTSVMKSAWIAFFYSDHGWLENSIASRTFWLELTAKCECRVGIYAAVAAVAAFAAVVTEIVAVPLA